MYIYNNNGTQEEVEPEVWGWGVVYENGDELKQFSEDGTFHRFIEIDQKRVKMFVMYKLEDMTKRIDMPVLGDSQLFHFYRNAVLNNGDKKVRVYVFGWKRNGETMYMYILPDDRIIASSGDVKLTDFNI